MRLRAVRRSSAGFGPCFADTDTIDGEFFDLFVGPLFDDALLDDTLSGETGPGQEVDCTSSMQQLLDWFSGVNGGQLHSALGHTRPDAVRWRPPARTAEKSVVPG